MTNRIKLLADRALAGEPPDIKIDLSRCVKVFGENELKPKLLREAAALCCYLTEYVPEIREGDLLLGDVRLNLLGYIPGFGTPIDPMPKSLKEGENKLWMMCGNHKTADFKRVIQIGLAGYLENISRSKQKFAADKEKTEFLTALEMVCHAVAQSAQNYANLCACMAKSEGDPVRKQELYRMAEIGARVPFHPAESFYEAVQSYWFIFSLFPDGVGRLDQYLNPFYEKDLKSGKITRAFALELIEALFVKIFERVGPSQPWSGDNHMVAAGYREDGSCGFCPVTELILEAVCSLPTWRPQVTVRWTKNTPFEDFLKAVLANQKRNDLVMFTNDEQIMTGLDAIGVPFRDAVEFSLSGCNELVLTGMSQMGSLEGHLNVMHALEAAMADKQALEHLTSYEAFFAHLCAFLKQDVDLCVALSEYWDRERGKSVDLLSSLFTDGALKTRQASAPAGQNITFAPGAQRGF